MVLWAPNDAPHVVYERDTVPYSRKREVAPSQSDAQSSEYDWQKGEGPSAPNVGRNMAMPLDPTDRPVKLGWVRRGKPNKPESAMHRDTREHEEHLAETKRLHESDRKTYIETRRDFIAKNRDRAGYNPITGEVYDKQATLVTENALVRGPKLLPMRPKEATDFEERKLVRYENRRPIREDFLQRYVLYFPINPNTVYCPSVTVSSVLLVTTVTTTYIASRLFAHIVHPYNSHYGRLTLFFYIERRGAPENAPERASARDAFLPLEVVKHMTAVGEGMFDGMKVDDGHAGRTSRTGIGDGYVPKQEFASDGFFSQRRANEHAGKDSASGLGPGLVPLEGAGVPDTAGFTHGAAAFDFTRGGGGTGGDGGRWMVV